MSDLVEEMAHRYLDEVELDLSALRAETEGTLRGRTFLGEVKAGEWELDVAVDDLRGRLQAGHPRLRFHSDRIEIEMPVKVRPAFGTITLDFAWDSAGLANVVCSDFQLSRKLEGSVLEQEHVLVGSVSERTPASPARAPGHAWEPRDRALREERGGARAIGSPLDERFDRGRLWWHADRAGIGTGATGPEAARPAASRSSSLSAGRRARR